MERGYHFSVNPMKKIVFATELSILAITLPAAESQIVHPFESDNPFVPMNPIDEHVLAALRERGIEPANLCSDEVFIRRAYLDIIGTLPGPREVREREERGEE